MSSIGGVLFDRDATYIDLGGSHHLGGGRLTSGRRVVVGAGEAELAKARDLLSSAGHGLDERLEKDHAVRMFADAPLLKTGQDEEDEETAGSEESSDSESSDSDSDSDEQEDEVNGASGGGVRMFEDEEFPEEGMDVDGDEEDESEAFLKAAGKHKVVEKEEFDYRHQNIKDAFDSKLSYALCYDLCPLWAEGLRSLSSMESVAQLIPSTF